MTDEQINVKIAELALDWNPNGEHWQQLRDGSFRTYYMLPNYCTDLNAMHDAEKCISYFPDYLFHLRDIVGPFPDSISEWTDHHWQDVVHATAKQRAIAFLKTKGIQSTQ
jgi:hypothetical protein